MKLKFLGAAQTVTGSKTVVEHLHQKYLVDCGLFQGPKEKRLLNWDTFKSASEFKAVVLTHAHLDHSGYIPKFVKEGFRGPIYASSGTVDLCKILLLDSGRLQEEDAKFANKSGYSHHQPALPLYSEADAAMSLNQFRNVEREEWITLGDDLSFKLSRSGHILGSSFIQMSFGGDSGMRLVTFSGDLGNHHSEILKPRSPLLETDYLVLESTYGDRNHPHTDLEQDLSKIVNRIFERQGVLIIPAFSVGRTQEILYLLRRLKDKNKIPNIPVYLDSPLATDATQIFMNHPEDHLLKLKDNTLESPFAQEDYTIVQSPDDSMLLCMQNGPMIVVSAAGMLTGGRVMHHLKHRLNDERNAVLFVGYQAEGTKGRLLQNGIKSLRIHHQEIPVEAEIVSLESLSAHADSDSLMDWLRNLKNKPRCVFLNHGEEPALLALKEKITTQLGFKVEIPEPGQEFKLG